MENRFDLNKLLEFAKEQAIGFSLRYSEASDELELQINSPAEKEEFYMKRVPNIDFFIEKWKEHIQK